MRLPGQRRDKMDIKKASDVIAMHLTLSDLRNCMCLLGVTSFQRHQFSAVHFSAEHFNAVHFSRGGEAFVFVVIIQLSGCELQIVNISTSYISAIYI